MQKEGEPLILVARATILPISGLLLVVSHGCNGVVIIGMLIFYLFFYIKFFFSYCYISCDALTLGTCIFLTL